MATAEAHRYTLEPYKGPATKHTCPGCGHRGKFARYVDTATGEHLADQVGRCDREDRCGYHLKPREYFANGGDRPSGEWTPPPMPPELPGYRMEREQVRPTIGAPCHLLEYLGTVKAFDPDTVRRTAWEYCVGGWTEPGKYYSAATFWQVDRSGQVRGAKVVQYDPSTGRRVKGLASWAHALTGGIPDGFRLDQCLFGEHLVNKYPAAPVGIVEAEKTALIARLFVPSVLWVAVGGLGELKTAKLLTLAGRDVVLWPDLGKGFTEWSAKVPDLGPLFNSLSVSTLLEEVATDAEREQGLDLADYLLRATIPEAPRPTAPASLPPPERITSEAERVLARWTTANPAVGTLLTLLDIDTQRARITPTTSR